MSLLVKYIPEQKIFILNKEIQTYLNGIYVRPVILNVINIDKHFLFGIKICIWTKFKADTKNVFKDKII